MSEVIPVFKYIINSNIINFLIMVYVLYRIVSKMDLASSFKKAINSVSLSIRQSEEEKADSAVKLKVVEQKVKELPEKIEEMEIQTKEKCDIFAKKIETTMDKSIENIENSIDKITKTEEHKIVKDITKKAFENAVYISRDKIIKMLEENKELHYKFIDESLNELGRL